MPSPTNFATPSPTSTPAPLVLNGLDNSSGRKRPHSADALAPSPAVQVTRHEVAIQRPMMAEFLRDPSLYECIVELRHPAIVQKSYQKEKRFFCPPPCVYLRGEGWKKKTNDVDRMYRERREAGRAAGVADKENITEKNAALLCAYIGIGGEQEPHLLDLQEKSFASARQLFIPDSDKRKYFELQLQMFYACGIDVGAFPSGRIRVVSKASKKRQDVKSTDARVLCIRGGTEVSLFNRTRASNSTRYLHVKEQGDGAYEASTQEWSAFKVYICEEDDSSQAERPTTFTARPGFLHYGDVIKVVDTRTGRSLPKMRIRKVVPASPPSHNHILLDPSTHGEPVAQLHKCALQVLEAADELTYLWMSHDTIMITQATRLPNSPQLLEVSDGAVWTIISVKTEEYRFFEAAGPARGPITPTPRVTEVETVGPTDNERLDLTGSGFTHNLKVWLHTVELETVIRNEELASARLPTLKTMMMACPGEQINNKKLPITFVREDGVIYRTTMSYTYRGYGV